MQHFIAYHNAKRMGYDYEPTGELKFLSKKVGLLKKAIGNTVWIIQGSLDGRKTDYTLRGAYIAERIYEESPSSDIYVIDGNNGIDIIPPIPLNSFPWFTKLLKSQSNFSLGFNRINDESIILALTEIQSTVFDSLSTTPLPDIDLAMSASEGAPRMVSHLRRERNRSLIESKKMATLSTTMKLACEVCGFDFSIVYGNLGDGFCEIHHKLPLSESGESVITTLDDLAVLCSNCHRIIHRTNPMLTVSELSRRFRSRA